ncbi:MAG: epoxyqueuosine reductase QueH [Oscillospiraceae bacterium]|nr:epoxyqueuosine reductase QueH [Oscillospiraceae bacterium]
MKENYQKELDAVVARLTDKPRLLLQSCCGPCSTYVLSYLKQYFDITLLYYNPNIQPRAEYDLRLENQRKVLAAMPEVHILECAYDGEAYNAAVRGLEGEPEGGARCTVCFRLRLEETARLAAEGKFDYFCTTLTVSPHKDAARINTIGRALGEQYGVAWLPSDFKKREGYKQSITLSRELDLYRQDYCGCLYSKNT